MTRIFKKHEDLYIFANIIELFFVRKIKCFLVFLSTDLHESNICIYLYNTKMFGKTFHIRRWKYLQQYAPCSKS